jgi:hypothetical protein
MPQCITEEDVILESFKKRFTPEAIESLFRSTTILGASMGRVEHLRVIVRRSEACDANLDTLLTNAHRLGVTAGRRSIFRMGVVLGMLMAEAIPRSTYDVATYFNGKDRRLNVNADQAQAQEREAAGCRRVDGEGNRWNRQ